MAFNSDWLQKMDKKNDNDNNNNNGNNKSRGIMHRLSSMSIGSGFNLLGTATKLSTDENVAGDYDSMLQSGNSSSDGGMSYGDRFKGFVVLIMSSSCFFLIAFTFLPTVILFPGKFALSFTCGSVLFMGSFAMLVGPSKYMKTICSHDRVSFSALYFGSLLLTLYSVFVARSYLYTLVSACAQVASLLWYASSYIPGGKYAMTVFSKMFCTTMKMILSPCLKFCGNRFGSMFESGSSSSSLPF